MASPESPDSSNSVSAAEWESFVANSLNGEDDVILAESFLQDMYMDARKMFLGTTGVTSILIYENGCEYHSKPKDSVPNNWPVSSPLEPINDTKHGPLFIVGDTDNNLSILLFQGSLLTSNPKELFKEDKPLFIMPEIDEDTYTETTLDGHQVLLSRAMVLGGHAVWRRAITGLAQHRYMNDYSELTNNDFDSVTATSVSGGERLYIPKYSLVSKGVMTKIEILADNETTTTLHI